MRQMKLHPAALLCCLFLLTGILRAEPGAFNANARFATLRAITEDHSLRIDPYLHTTEDWSLSPNGSHYSNKAPLPTFLALPVYFAAREIVGPAPPEGPAMPVRILVCFFVQMLPLALLAYLAALHWEREGISRSAQAFAALALLFGNTAAAYSGVFFGHATTGALFLAAFWLLQERKVSWAGFFWALALTSDYGVLYTIPAMPFLLNQEARGRSLARFLLGAAPPVALLGLYHTVCFGKPWALPLAYLNPALATGGSAVVELGSTGILPSPEIVARLLFGPERGLLFTQPWIFLLFLRARSAPTRAALLALAGLLWMNASFASGWQAGWAAGPRYLSAVLPLLAFLTAGWFEKASPRARRLGILLLGVGLGFHSLVFAAGVIVDAHALWPYYLRAGADEGAPHWIKAGFFLALLGAGTLAFRLDRKARLAA